MILSVPQVLRTSLKKLANLWKQCVRGVVNVIYVPAKKGVEKVRSKLTIAYSNIRKAYDYGKKVLRRTYNSVKANVQRFYRYLAQYYHKYYDRYKAYFRRIISPPVPRITDASGGRTSINGYGNGYRYVNGNRNRYVNGNTGYSYPGTGYGNSNGYRNYYNTSVGRGYPNAGGVGGVGNYGNIHGVGNRNVHGNVGNDPRRINGYNKYRTAANNYPVNGSTNYGINGNPDATDANGRVILNGNGVYDTSTTDTRANVFNRNGQTGQLPGQRPAESGVPPRGPGSDRLPPRRPGSGKIPPRKPGEGRVPPRRPGEGRVPPRRPSAGRVPPRRPGKGRVPPRKPGEGRVPPRKPGKGKIPPRRPGPDKIPPRLPGGDGALSPGNGSPEIPAVSINGDRAPSHARNGPSNAQTQPSGQRDRTIVATRYIGGGQYLAFNKYGQAIGLIRPVVSTNGGAPSGIPYTNRNSLARGNAFVNNNRYANRFVNEHARNRNGFVNRNGQGGSYGPAAPAAGPRKADGRFYSGSRTSTVYNPAYGSPNTGSSTGSVETNGTEADRSRNSNGLHHRSQPSETDGDPAVSARNQNGSRTDGGASSRGADPSTSSVRGLGASHGGPYYRKYRPKHSDRNREREAGSHSAAQLRARSSTSGADTAPGGDRSSHHQRRAGHTGRSQNRNSIRSLSGTGRPPARDLAGNGHFQPRKDQMEPSDERGGAAAETGRLFQPTSFPKHGPDHLPRPPRTRVQDSTSSPKALHHKGTKPRAPSGFISTRRYSKTRHAGFTPRPMYVVTRRARRRRPILRRANDVVWAKPTPHRRRLQRRGSGPAYSASWAASGRREGVHRGRHRRRRLKFPQPSG